MASVIRNLFGSGKKNLLNFSVLRADMHSHLIPGIDDGSDSIAESREMIHGLRALGFSKFVTTPHIMPGVFDNSPDTIRKGMTLLTNADPQLPVSAAAEYYVDEAFVKKVQEGMELLSFGERYLLIEMHMHVREKQLESAIFELRLRGFRPVLAHVERYPYLFNDQLTEFEKLRDADVLLQVNLRSFIGQYGELQKKIARRLADADMIHFLGTDIHRSTQLPAISAAMEEKYVQQLLAKGGLLNATL